MKTWIVVLLGALMACGTVWAQTPAIAPAKATPTTAEAKPVQTDTQARVEVPAATPKAMEFYHSGNVLWLFGQAFDIVVPALILFTGFSARLRNVARRVGRNWFFTVAVYYALFTLFTFAIGLPLSYYREFVRPHAYGLSDQTLQKWTQDTLIELALSVAIGALLLWIPYLLIKKSPRRWWFYTGLLAIPFMCFAMLLEPLYIAPLFNDFGAMKDKALESRILALADRAGIEGARVYEVNKSVDTKTVNAYVTGFMGSKRIVLWDTLLKRLNPEETLVVMGHEMGHYVLNHVAWSIAFFSLTLMLGLYLIYRISGGLIARYGQRFGFDALDDVASLPLIMVLASVMSLVFEPVALAYSRHHEHEADRFGLEITQDNHAAAMAFVKLQTENLANPRPGLLYVLWRGSHPSIGDRIDFMNDYHPWREGKPSKYGEYFKAPVAKK